MKNVTKIFAWFVVLIFYFIGCAKAGEWIGTNMGKEIADLIIKETEKKNGK